MQPEHNARPSYNSNVESNNQSIRSQIRHQQPQQKQKSPEKTFAIKQHEQKLYQSAFSERRKQNLITFKDYFGRRVHSYNQRLTILALIQTTFNEKVGYTKNFVKQLIKYFQQYLILYESYFKGMGKLNIQKKPKDTFIYESIFEAVGQLSKGNDFEVQKTKGFTTWIQSILIPALKTALNIYNDPIKQLRKQFEKLQQRTQQSREKQTKMFQKLDGNGDLLEKEILLIQRIKKTNQQNILWGQYLLQSWQKLIEHENTLRSTMKQNVLDFAQRFLEVYNKGESIENLLKFWRSMPKSPKLQQIFASFFSQKVIQQISSQSKSKRLVKQLEDYIHMQQEQSKVGNPALILKILQNKKFSVKVPKDKTQRQWFQAEIYFTVDKNIIMFRKDEAKVHSKIKQKSLTIKRISENILQISGVQQGFFLDSKHKQLVHFQTIDSLEQFVCFVQMLEKQSK